MHARNVWQIEELHAAGHDIEFRRCGALEVISTEEQLAHAQEAVAQAHISSHQRMRVLHVCPAYAYC